MKLINISGYELKLWNEYTKYIHSQTKSVTHIESIFVCSKENYLKTIQSINPLERITNNYQYEGFGKTIYLDKKNFIFLREEIALLIEKTNCTKLPTIKDLTLNDQLPYYLLFHEIGHCIDNTKRKISPRHTFDSGAEFKIKEHLDFYFTNLTCEYFAQEYVKNIVSDDFIENHYQDLHNDYSVMINSYKENKQLYKNDLRKHVISNLNTFNVFLTQYVKYLSLANKGYLLEKFVLYSHSYFQLNINRRNLEKYFLASTMKEDFFQTCLKNFELYGFKFVENMAGNDGFYY